jgi:three-Cys-motif partner protein
MASPPNKDIEADVTKQQLRLFELPEIRRSEVLIPRLKYPIWTENKARLIERYLFLFVMITKHGTYIDGFAGPQEAEEPGMWAAKLVLESEPRWFRQFFLCDSSRKQVDALNALVSGQPSKKKGEPRRVVDVISGDFNKVVHDILGSGKVKEKEAAFCLLDQRTFECHWETLRVLSGHKASGRKIELFYFLPIKWLQRALSGQQDVSVVERWWGRSDTSSLRGMANNELQSVICERFRDELRYASALAWPIWERENAGSIMYYMIHASDHPDAPNLMARAYRQAVGAKEPREQFLLELGAWQASR